MFNRFFELFTDMGGALIAGVNNSWVAYFMFGVVFICCLALGILFGAFVSGFFIVSFIGDFKHHPYLMELWISGGVILTIFFGICSIMWFYAHRRRITERARK